MITRVYTALAREVQGVHQAAYVLAGFSLASSLLALVRDRLLAHLFGAGYALDVYYAAFRIPDLLFVAIGSMVSVYALIPIILSRSESERIQTLNAVFSSFLLFSAVVSGIMFVAAPYVLPRLFPALAAEHFDQLLWLTRILLLQPILLGASNVLAAVTQLKQRYMLYALSPVIYNVGIIFGALFFYPVLGLTGLAWGVVLGAVGHALIQLPWIMREGFLRKIPLTFNLKLLLETAYTSFPRSLALSFGQFTMLVLTAIASMLAPGSITVFTFAFNLQSVPLALIGASYSVAAFPTLAKMAVEGHTQEFMRHLVSVSRHIILWSVPAAALLIVLRAHVVRVILGSGAFDWTDTRLTAAALALFAVSIPLHALMLLLLRGYYAAGLVRVPLMATGASAIASIAAGWVLTDIFVTHESFRFFIESMLRIEDVAGTTMIMLPLAYTLGVAMAVIVLIIDTEIRYGGFLGGIKRVCGEAVSAGVIGGAAAYAMLGILGEITPTATLVATLTHGAAAGIVGMLTGYVVLTFLDSKELQEVLKALSARVWKIAPVGSAEEER